MGNLRGFSPLGNAHSALDFGHSSPPLLLPTSLQVYPKPRRRSVNSHLFIPVFHAALLSVGEAALQFPNSLESYSGIGG